MAKIYKLQDVATVINRHYSWVNEKAKIATTQERFEKVRVKDRKVSANGWCLDLELFVAWLKEEDPGTWEGFDPAGGMERLRTLRKQLEVLEPVQTVEKPPESTERAKGGEKAVEGGESRQRGTEAQRHRGTDLIAGTEINEIRAGIVTLAKRMPQELTLAQKVAIEREVGKRYFHALAGAVIIAFGLLGLVAVGGYEYAGAKAQAEERAGMIAEKNEQLEKAAGRLEAVTAELGTARSRHDEVIVKLEGARNEVIEWARENSALNENMIELQKQMIYDSDPNEAVARRPIDGKG